MKFRVVIDTNIWIRILLKGRVTLPVLEALNEDKETYGIRLLGVNSFLDYLDDSQSPI
jgi:predicted nucleic acid-binding protein